MKVFVFGRPGCGKSRAARRIVKLAKLRHYSASRINDYPILRGMFREDTAGKQFRALEGHEGFDVIDFSVLDTALKIVEEKALRYERFSDVIVLEFARSDYEAALKQFSREFLKDAYFLFIDTDVETCIQRIYHRVAYSATSDDYFVSEEILRSYYSKQHFPRNLAGQKGIDAGHILSIHNKGSKQDFDRGVNSFVEVLFKHEQRTTHTPVHMLRPVTGILKKIRHSLPSLAGASQS